MLTRLMFAIAVFAAVGCSKKEGPSDKGTAKATATTTTGTVDASGVRTIAVEASEKGYEPETIAGKPGEKLKLVFTRTGGGSCTAELKTPDGKLVELPMNKPVDVAVTLPAQGEMSFACGMDMFHGKIVVQKPAT